jgi:hypothetical protein
VLAVVLGLMTSAAVAQDWGPSWVKLRRTHREQMFSALPSNSDIR